MDPGVGLGRASLTPRARRSGQDLASLHERGKNVGIAMLRSSTLATVLLAGLLPGCHDAPTLPPGPSSGPADTRAPGPEELDDTLDHATVVRVVGNEIRIDDELVAQARPAAAPGGLDEELRATYVLAPLRKALREAGRSAATVVVLAPEAPLGHLRAVLTSAAGPVRVLLDRDPARAALTTTHALPRVQLAGPETEPPPELAIELPDDRPVGAVEALAVPTAEAPTLVLATDFAPCVVPPAGMRCIAGSGAAEHPTFYIDEADVTLAQYEACREAGACRGLGGRKHRAPASVSTSPEAPARLGLDPERAQAYCAWAGKRVATPSEQATAGLAHETEALRCATEHPFLTRFPPRILEAPRSPLALPEPPTPEELAIFTRVVDDPVQDKKICGAKVRASWHPSQLDGGRSEPGCRDPFTYLTTNEPRGYVWHAYIRDIGGAYVGIGSDQSYAFIAVARSRWAWVMDYDPRVVQNHLRLRAFILASPTPADFVALFAPEGKRRALAILDEAYADDPRLGILRWGYVATREDLHPYFVAQRKPSRRQRMAGKPMGWLRDPEAYRYIRTMFEQGRIAIKAGDLLMDGAMQQMGAAAHELGVPVRIYYTSNAPTAWGGQITPAYRRNVLALPFDVESLVLQTTDGGGSLLQKTKWHHNVQWGRLVHERLEQPGYDDVWKLLEGRIPGDDQALTVLGLPSG